MSRFELYNLTYFKSKATSYLQYFYNEDAKLIEETLKEMFDLDFVVKDLVMDFDKDFFIYQINYSELKYKLG